MAKITSFIIMLVAFMMIFAGGFASLMASINTNYSPSGYNESKLEIYNKLDEMSEDSEEIKNKTMHLKSESGAFDVLGNFFQAAYDTLQVSVGSFSLFNDMKNAAMDDVGIHDPKKIYSRGIGVIVIVVIFLGIIIAAVVKREL